MTVTRFIELLETAGYKPESYSGRAMYGYRCVAVIIDGPQGLVGLGLALAEACDTDETGEGGPLPDELTTLIHFLRRGERTDSMGRTGTVVYWPDIAWPEDRKEDDDVPS